jgi:superfamily II DNA or RNA helicase
MPRAFTSKQRHAIYLASGGKCQSCGADISQGFHADHIIPYSAGGKTDVANGQALCAACNLSKGSKMPIQLRNWQAMAQERTVNHYGDGNKFYLLQATPGGGKTICALSIFDEMKRRGMVTHCVILAPSTTLVIQWREDAVNTYGHELNNSMLNSWSNDFDNYSGMVMTYQAMNEIHESLRIFCANNNVLVIADEMHHVADGQSWGESFHNAFSESSHILGLTGTPWASQGKTIPYVRYNEKGYAETDFKYSKKDAIFDGVCRVTEFHLMEPTKLSFVWKDTGEEKEFKTIQEAKDAKVPAPYLKTLEHIEHMKKLFEDADEQLSMLRASGVTDAGGLIVAPNIKTAHAFQDELLSLYGEEYPIVHSKAEKPHQQIDKFRKGSERWLISVDMVTEGVDIKRLQVCVFLSNKNTELFIRQVIGRIERRRDKDNYVDQGAYFYYTDTPEFSDLIKQLEEENEAGLALLTCKKCNMNPCTCLPTEPKSGDGPGQSDDVFLREVETDHQGLIAQGYTYDKEIVLQAKKRKRSSTILQDVPLFVICKVILSERETEKLIDLEAIRLKPKIIPLDVKKERLRQRINKELIRKLSAAMSGKASGDAIRLAHKNTNRAVGIRFTSNETSLNELERKLAYITETEARSWL